MESSEFLKKVQAAIRKGRSPLEATKLVMAEMQSGSTKNGIRFSQDKSISKRKKDKGQ